MADLDNLPEIVGIITHLIGDGVEKLLGQEHTNLGKLENAQISVAEFAQKQL